MLYRLGIDVGGTFTDFLLVDEGGNAEVYKSLTTAKDPSQGVIEGLETIAESKGSRLEKFLQNIALIVHGTTITTNAIVTRTGAKTGFVTTKGFRDALILKRGVKKEQYNFHCSPPPPIVPRYLIQVVEERVNCEGQEVTPLVESDVYQAIDKFNREGVEAVGVTFLFSFLNPGHEIRAGEILKKEMPNAFITLSSEVMPQVRLYERCSTTVLNSYVGVVLGKYLERFQQQLKGFKFNGVLLIMQSNGGVMSPEIAAKFPVNTLLSGPAGGPIAGLAYASHYNTSDIITIDMGGTSFDTCLVKGGVAPLRMGGEIGGQWISTPMLDIHTIGAGGGSIAWVDAGGILQVGPQSAGADPGPVCYDRGGELPTVTDADLLLGYLDPNYFAGGRIKLNIEKATKAIEVRIAKPLNISVIEAAAGIYRLINSTMSSALAVITTQRGFDPRDFSIITAGGAGPIHATAIAEDLGISRTIVPRHSSVFCAEGMLMCDLRYEYVRTYPRAVEDVDIGTLNQLYSDIAAEGTRTLIAERIAPELIEITYDMDMRYIGQYSEVTVPFQVGNDGEISHKLFNDIVVSFHKLHDTLYGYSLPNAKVEIVNLRLSCKGITDKPKMMKHDYKGEDASPTLKNKRPAFFNGKFIETPVYDVEKLDFGNIVNGPALLEHATTTVVVPPGWVLTCDEYGNFEVKM